MAGSLDSYLEQLLKIHWLRPETALWRAFDCLLMERHGHINGISVDLGCGDGTMSYVMAGGKIQNYDVFQDVAGLDQYNAGADVHDVASRSDLNLDSSGLRYRFSQAFDHKEGLIAKARRFGDFYQDATTQDLNTPLPLKNESIDSAFSNILYWLGDLDCILTDWQRSLKPGGNLNLFVPGQNFREKSWLYYMAPHDGDKRYLNFFDRGYAVLIQHCLSGAQWTDVFTRNGFKIRHHEPYLSDPVMDIWNIGTRPISPLLIKMADKLSAQDRTTAKAEWVDYFTGFFKPILEGELGRTLNDKQAGFHFFVLEKP